MSRLAITCLGAIALIASACSSSGSTPSVAGAACSAATGTAAVAASIMDFSFEPAAITARVGDVIAFTNTGFEPHNATLDAGGCATKTLQTGDVDGLRFTIAGSYPFHCAIHTQMTGTITVGA